MEDQVIKLKIKDKTYTIDHDKNILKNVQDPGDTLDLTTHEDRQLINRFVRIFTEGVTK